MDFEDLIGNDDVKQKLEKAYLNGTISNTLLFSGPNGIGKSLFALALTCKLMHPEKDIDPIALKKIEESKIQPEEKITSGKEKILAAKKVYGVKKVSKPKLKPIESDFNIKQFLTEIATESEFERLIYKSLFGKVARGSNEAIEKKLEVGLKKFRELFD